MASSAMAASVSTVNTAATALDFEGLGGSASAATAGGLNTSLELLAGWVQEKPPIVASAVAAYEAAVSAMIPAEVSLANRSEQAANVAMNPLVLGALTPAITALDLTYFGEHWPHNAGAGAVYGSALTALLPALAVPPPMAPPGASPAAPAAAAQAVAETAAQTAAGEAMKGSAEATKLAGDGAAAPAEAAGQVGQLASTMMQPLQSAVQPLTGMFQAPMQALQSLGGMPQSMLGQLGGLFGAGLSGEAAGEAAGEVVAPAAVGGVAGLGTGLSGFRSGLDGLGAGGVGGVGSAAMPGAGLTTYTRPTSSFAAEASGRPVGLKSGLLSAAELRGPTSTSGGGMPVSPGMLGQSKGEKDRRTVPHARLVPAFDSTPENRG